MTLLHGPDRSPPRQGHHRRAADVGRRHPRVRSGASPTVPCRPLRRGLLPYGRRHRGKLGRGLLFTGLLVAARLALPLPLTQVVDRSASSPDVSVPGSAVALLSAAFVSLALVAGLAEHHQRLAFAQFAGRSISDARDRALIQVAALPGGGTVDRTAEVMGDSARVKQGLKGVLNHITVNGLLVVGVCVALTFIDMRLALVQLAGASAIALVAVLGATQVAAVAAEHRERETALAGSVHRLVADSLTDDGSAGLAALRDLDADSGAADIGMTRWEGATTWVVHIVLAATAAVVLGIAVQAAQDGRMTVGTLFTVLAYLLVLHGPAVRFARQMTRIGPLVVSARHLGWVLAR